LDAGFIEQQVGPLGAIYLEAAFVVPLYRPVQSFAVAKHKNHCGLGLHLLDIIEVLGVGLVRWNRLLLRWRGPPGRRDLFLDFVQRRTNELTIDSFHWMPSFD